MSRSSLALARGWRQRENLAGWALTILSAAFFGLAAYSISCNEVPWSDEAAIFNEANWIRERGWGGFLTACLSGEYPYHNTNPALQLLLAPVMERSLDAVRRARALEIALAATGLAMLYPLTRRRLGRVGAVTLISLLGATHLWTRTASLITVEPLSVLGFFAGWWLLVQRRQTHAKWFAAGLIVGVAWWFKASALLLAFALLAAAPIRATQQRLWGRCEEWRAAAVDAGLFFGGALFLTWPLLLCRFLARGNPLYSEPSVYLWIDHWEQHFLYQQGLQKFGPLEWFRTHTLFDAGGRIAVGLKNQIGLLAQMFDFGWGASVTHITSIGILALAVVGILFLHGWSRIFTVTLIAISLLSLAWYIHTPDLRLTGMLSPLLAALAVMGAAGMARRLRQNPIARTRWPHLRWGLAASAVLISITAQAGRITPTTLRSPLAPMAAPRSYQELTHWLLLNVAATGARCLQTPGLYPEHEVHWLIGRDDLFINIPPWNDFEALDRYAQQRGVKYLILDRGSVRLRAALFAPYAKSTDDGMVEFFLPNWKLTARASGGEWIIFERIKSE